MAAFSVEEGVREARRCWDQKLNCAESVLRGVCHAYGVDLPDTAKRMATPFGGGVGRSEDLCGALSGGVMALGAVMGRVFPDEDKMPSYDAAGRLFRLFRENLGSTSCSDLNRGDFTSPEHRPRCGRIVETSTRLTLQVIGESK